MTFKEWLKNASNNRSNDFRNLLPELKLMDGTELSVQASEFHMCEPKAKLEDGDYYCVEVYTHGIEVKELKETCYEVSPYIYGYVPVEFMETLCLLHGGISNETKISLQRIKSKPPYYRRSMQDSNLYIDDDKLNLNGG